MSEIWERLHTRVSNLVSRAIVRLVNDAAQTQLLQLSLLADETRAGVERAQNYGFTSVPLAGAEAVVLFVGGRRDHGLAVAVDDSRYRLTGLVAGEVAVYTDEGDKVVISRGGTITITAATKVVVSAPLAEICGNTQAAYNGTSHRAADATLSAAHATFLTALGTYATAIKPIADPTNAATPALTAAVTTLSTAITAYESAAAAALSLKVKLS